MPTAARLLATPLPEAVDHLLAGLFLHRLFPGAAWADDIVRDERSYDTPGWPEWVSGACILVRRWP